jgi:hypothetical protein
MLLLGWKSTWVRCLKGPIAEQQRADLGFVDNVLKDESLSDPLLFGLACLDYLTRTGRSARELAKVLKNKSASTITRAVARVQKLPPDLHDLIRRRLLSADAATPLTALADDEEKRRFARLYCEGKLKSAAELTAAIRGAKNGNAAAGFTCEESGVRIAVTLPGKDLAAAEPALRVLLKDLREQSARGLEHFQQFLVKKAHTTKKAAELEAAQIALAGHAGSNGTASNSAHG